MRRGNVTPILIAFLSLVAAPIPISIVTANPVAYMPFPPKPITTPPTIFTYSPKQNQTYTSTEVALDFTVIKPDEWFGKKEPLGYYNFGIVKSVSYTLDSNEPQNLTLPDNEKIITEDKPIATLHFSVSLNLTEGQHSVEINVKSYSFYWRGLGLGLDNYNVSTAVIQTSSDPINFTVELPKPAATAPANTPTPAVADQP